MEDVASGEAEDEADEYEDADIDGELLRDVDDCEELADVTDELAGDVSTRK